MSDLIYVALVVAFFAVAMVLVRACEHIIGPDEPAATPGGATTPEPAEAVVR